MTDSNEVYVQLPPDPAPEEATTPVDQTWDDALVGLAEDLQQVISVPTVAKPTAATTFVDENGVLHTVVPMTKHTKGIVGTIAAVSAIVATNVAALLPDGPTKLYILGGVGVVGAVATFLGITLPTNLAKTAKK